MTDSLWLPNCVIDDSTSGQSVRAEASQMGVSCGYEERQTPYLEGVGKRFGLPLIPQEEWPERIREREAKGFANWQLRKHCGLRPLNQRTTKYCWANGVIQALHYLQLKSGESLRPLSPASVAAPIKGFRNVGGWGDLALEYIMANGCNEQKDWPANAIDRRYYTAGNREKAKVNAVTEWYDLKTRVDGFAELVTCLLHGIPSYVAYMWWGHLVLAIDPVLRRGEVCILIDNSHGPGYGDDGMGVICGRKKYADEAGCPRVLNAGRELAA